MPNSYLPPRRRDWKKGKLQVGLAIRTKDGSYLEIVNNEVDDEVAEMAWKLLTRLFLRRLGEIVEADTIVE